MHIPVTLITLIAAYFVPRVSSGDQCFNIGQVQVGIDSVGADYLPCQPSASSSSCCPLGWICLSNGLCEPLPGNSTQNHGLTSLYTGFCTDPSWKNETVCPRVCNNNVTLTADVGNGVIACGNGHFCCYGEGDDQCCSTPSNVFSLGVATDITTLTGPNPTTTSPLTNTPTATISFSRTSPASAVPNNSTTSSIASASIVTSAAKVASTPVATFIPEAGLNRKVAIGTGVGVGTAVGLTILAGFVCFVRRRSTALSKSPMCVAEKNEMDGGASAEKGARVHELMTERRFMELAGDDVRAELDGPYGPRAEMG